MMPKKICVIWTFWPVIQLTFTLLSLFREIACISTTWFVSWITGLNVQNLQVFFAIFASLLPGILKTTSEIIYFKDLNFWERLSQILNGAVVVTLCQNEAEVKFSMSIWYVTSASFWQRVQATAPFNDWLLRVHFKKFDFLESIQSLHSKSLIFFVITIWPTSYLSLRPHSHVTCNIKDPLIFTYFLAFLRGWQFQMSV